MYHMNLLVCNKKVDNQDFLSYSNTINNTNTRILVMNTLKTLTSVAVLVSALAGAANAEVTVTGDNTVRWAGTTPQFAGQCSFSGAADQDMNFDEAENTWTVSSLTDAVITVTMRDVTSVGLEPVDSKLYKSEDNTLIGDVDVNYVGTVMSWDYTASNGQAFASSATKSSTSTTPNQVIMSAGAFTMTGTIEFDIEGKVSHSQAITDSLESNTNYYVDHMITCIQG